MFWNNKVMPFSEQNHTDKPVLLDFSADWCGSCQTMIPVIEELKSRMGSELHVLEIDVDKNPQTAAQMDIRNVPTFILFQSGKEVWRRVGLITLKELTQKIQTYIRKQ